MTDKLLKKKKKQIEQCTRCFDNVADKYGYCKDCASDLISAAQAAKLLNVSTYQVARIVENHPGELRFLPYSSQVRLSRAEVTAFSKTEFDKVAAVKPSWSYHFTKCRTCNSTENEHYGGGYCIECFPDTTEAAVLEGYIEGENLSEVAERLGFTRERSRQFFKRAINIEAERTDLENMDVVAKEFKERLKITHKQNRARAKYKSFIESNYQDIVKRITGDLILSSDRLLKELKLPASAIHIIEADYPEILQIIAKNEKRWSWNYDHCRMCGTTDNKHRAYGYCLACYYKSDEWKKHQDNYRQRNVDKIREQQREYSIEYSKRPEVIERQKQRHNEAKYDGNRDIALQRADYKCEECGLSQSDHLTTYDKDLFVYHADGDPDNNDMGNLKVLCMSCSVKRTTSMKGR